MKDRFKRILLCPENLFLFFAILFGFILAGAIPPLGGGDEGFHYHRIASIAYFQMLNKPVMLPAGIIHFLQAGREQFYSGMMPPFKYNLQKWQEVAGITLNAADTQTLVPNFMTVHNPFAYLPQAIVFRLGAVAGFSPLTLLYLARITGMLVGVLLTCYAIRIIPSHKYALATLALLPVITVTRSTLDADSIVEGLAFLFIALVLREVLKTEAFRLRDLAMITVTGFLMGQCKSPYLLLLLLTIAIPVQRFSSVRARVAALAIIILPATMASIAWMVAIKAISFAGVSYHTWAGDANPDMQVALILHNPVAFAGLLLKNLFMTSLLPVAVFGTFCDVGPGYPLSFLIMGILIYAMIGSAISSGRETNTDYGRITRFLCAAIFILVIPVIMTLIYIHWNGLYAQKIQGFQGRYFYPTLPLLFPFAHAAGNTFLSWAPYKYTMLAVCIGLGATVLTIMMNYY